MEGLDNNNMEGGGQSSLSAGACMPLSPSAMHPTWSDASLTSGVSVTEATAHVYAADVGVSLHNETVRPPLLPSGNLSSSSLFSYLRTSLLLPPLLLSVPDLPLREDSAA